MEIQWITYRAEQHPILLTKLLIARNQNPNRGLGRKGNDDESVQPEPHAPSLDRGPRPESAAGDPVEVLSPSPSVLRSEREGLL